MTLGKALSLRCSCPPFVPKMNGVGVITASHPQTAGSGGLLSNIDSRALTPEFFSIGLGVGLGMFVSEVFQIIPNEG